MVSAVQIGGRRLHELARAGIEVEREPRPVTVHQFGVEPTEDPLVFAVDVRCSSGTYVRSLAADLGHALGGGAPPAQPASHRDRVVHHRRGATRSTRSNAAGVLTPAAAMRDYEHVSVSDDVAEAVAHGKVLPADALTVAGRRPVGARRRRGRCCSRCTRRTSLAPSSPPSSFRPLSSLTWCGRFAISTHALVRLRARPSPSARTTVCTAAIAPSSPT